MRRTGWLVTGMGIALTVMLQIRVLARQELTATQIKPEAESHGKVDAIKAVKTPILARNTSAKPSEPTKAETAKPQAQDKKTISRCWKRLMNMVRELNHVHRANKANK